MVTRKYICPACRHQTGVSILYGMPSHEAWQMSERNEIALGGCMMEIESPERKCTDCGHEWRIKRVGSAKIKALRFDVVTD